MIFSNGMLKNKKIKRDNYSEAPAEAVVSTVESVVTDASANVKLESIEATKEKVLGVASYLNDYFKNKTTEAQVYFDSEIISHLDMFHNFIASIIPDYPKYYEGADGKYKINYQAFLDARDFLLNEMGFDPSVIVYSSELGGTYNNKLLSFDNGFSIDSNGLVKNNDGKTVFNPNDPSEKVDYIDLLNEKIIFDGGVIVDMPDRFIEDFFLSNEYVPQSLKDDYSELAEKIENAKNGEAESDAGVAVFAKINGVSVPENLKILMEMETTDLYSGDIFGEEPSIDLLSQLKRYFERADVTETCNFSSIPYAELTELLMRGGGERGVMPLSRDTLGSNDIKFKTDGTAYYDGSNSKVSVSRSGCSKATYKTGHIMMWSESNKMGLKRSSLQRLYSICDSLGIFNANLPPLFGWKKHKILPGLCIGGLLEKAIVKEQEKVSKRINELFKCTPVSLPVDFSESGFTGATYDLVGASSVNRVEDLKTIVSVKSGMQFIVKTVDEKISGLSGSTVGLFTYDPNREYISQNHWVYGEWCGKPLGETVAVNYNTTENQALYELVPVGSLGVDSITNNLLSLQYAYAARESLLEKDDVESAMARSLETIIRDVVDNADINLLSFDTLAVYETREYEDNSFIDLFYNYFEKITLDLVMPKFSNNKNAVYKTVADSEAGASKRVLDYYYYDFTSYDYEKYLLPSKNYISYYDHKQHAKQYVTENPMLKNFYDNKEYYESLGLSNSFFKNCNTLYNYIMKSENKDALLSYIDETIKYKEKEIQYHGGWSDETLSQLNERVWNCLKEIKIQ